MPAPTTLGKCRQGRRRRYELTAWQLRTCMFMHVWESPPPDLRDVARVLPRGAPARPGHHGGFEQKYKPLSQMKRNGVLITNLGGRGANTICIQRVTRGHHCSQTVRKINFASRRTNSLMIVYAYTMHNYSLRMQKARLYVNPAVSKGFQIQTCTERRNLEAHEEKHNMHVTSVLAV